MTPKQERFIEELTKDWNATQAAIRSGYSPASASIAGTKLLKKPHIKAEVAKRRAVLTQKAEEFALETIMDANRVLRENTRIGTFDPRKMFHADGRPKGIHELDDETAAAIGSFETGVMEDEDGTPRYYVKKMKATDKGAALDRHFKHLGLYAKDNEQTASQVTAQYLEMQVLIQNIPGSKFTAVIDAPDAHLHQ